MKQIRTETRVAFERSPSVSICGCIGLSRPKLRRFFARPRIIRIRRLSVRITFARDFAARYVAYMTAAKVIEEIMHLPREEQSRVVEFAFELARKRQLSGKELSALAQRMVDADDLAEVERLKAEITRGFYGD